MKEAGDDRQEPELLLEDILGLGQPNACSLACSSTGMLAYPAGNSVVLCKPGASAQRCFLRARGTAKPFACVAFSANGKHLAAGGEGDQALVCVWETDGPEVDCIAAFRGHKYGVASLAFSPDGKYLASAGAAYDGQLYVWDWTAGALIAKEQTQAQLRGLSWADAGTTVVSVGRSHLKVWTLSKATGLAARMRPSSASGFALKPRAVALRSQKDATFVAAAAVAPRGGGEPDGESDVLVLTAAGRLGLLSASGKDFDKLKDLKVKEAFGMATSSDLIACAAAGGSVHLLTTSLAPKAILPPPGLSAASDLCTEEFNEGGNAVACSFDDSGESLWVAYSDRSLVEWDVHDASKASVKYSEHSHAGSITDLCLLHSGSEGPSLPQVKVATCSSDGAIGIWEISTETEPGKRGATMSLMHVAQPPSPQKPVSRRPSMDDVPLPQPAGPGKGRARAGQAALTCLAESPDGSHLAAGDINGRLRVFSLRSRECLVDRVVHSGAVCSLDFSPVDETGGFLLASGGKDGTVRAFNAERGYALQQTLVEHSAEVTAVRFAANGSGLYLVSSGADKAIVFRTLPARAGDQFKLVAKETMPRGVVTDLAVVRDGQHAVSIGQDRWIRIWDVSTGSLRNSFQGQTMSKELLKMAVAPCSTCIAVSCADGLVRLHSMSDGSLLGTSAGQGQAAAGLTFTEGSCKLLSAGLDGCIRVWTVPAAVVSSCCETLQAPPSMSRVTLPPLTLPTSSPSLESAATHDPPSSTSRRLRRRISPWESTEQACVNAPGTSVEKLNSGVKSPSKSSYGKENSLGAKDLKVQSPAKPLGTAKYRSQVPSEASFLRCNPFTEGSEDVTPTVPKERYRLKQDLAAMQQQLSDLGKDWSALKNRHSSRKKVLKAVKPATGAKAKASVEIATKELPPLLASEEPPQAETSAAVSRKRELSSSEGSDDLQTRFSSAGFGEAFSPSYSIGTHRIVTRLSFSAAMTSDPPARMQPPRPAGQPPTPTAPSQGSSSPGGRHAPQTQPSSCDSTGASIAFGVASRKESEDTPKFWPATRRTWNQIDWRKLQPAFMLSCEVPALVHGKAAYSGNCTLESRFNAVHATVKEPVGGRVPTPIPLPGQAFQSPSGSTGWQSNESPTGLTPLLEEAGTWAGGDDSGSLPSAEASPLPQNAGPAFGGLETSGDSGDQGRIDASSPVLMQNPFYDSSTTPQSKVPQLRLANLQLDSNPAFDSECSTGTYGRMQRALARLRSQKALYSPDREAENSVLQAYRGPSHSASSVLPELRQTTSPEPNTGRQGSAAKGKVDLQAEPLQLTFGELPLPEADGQLGSLLPEEAMGQLKLPVPMNSEQLHSLVPADAERLVPEDAEGQLASPPEYKAEKQVALLLPKAAAWQLVLGGGPEVTSDAGDDVLLGSSMEGSLGYAGQAGDGSPAYDSSSRIAQQVLQAGNPEGQFTSAEQLSSRGPLGAVQRGSSYQLAGSDASRGADAESSTPCTASAARRGDTGTPPSAGNSARPAGRATGACKSPSSVQSQESDSAHLPAAPEEWGVADEGTPVSRSTSASSRAQMDRADLISSEAQSRAKRIQQMGLSHAQAGESSSQRRAEGAGDTGTKALASPYSRDSQPGVGGSSQVPSIRRPSAQQIPTLHTAGVTEETACLVAAGPQAPNSEQPSAEHSAAKANASPATPPVQRMQEDAGASGAAEGAEAQVGESLESDVGAKAAKKTPAGRLWSTLKFWKRPPQSERQGVYNSSLIALAKQGKKSRMQKAVTPQVEPPKLPEAYSVTLPNVNQVENITVPSLAPKAADEPDRLQSEADPHQTTSEEEEPSSSGDAQALLAQIDHAAEPLQHPKNAGTVARKLSYAQKNNPLAAPASQPAAEAFAESRISRQLAQGAQPAVSGSVVLCAGSEPSPVPLWVVVPPADAEQSHGPSQVPLKVVVPPADAEQPQRASVQGGWNGLFGAGMLAVISPGASRRPASQTGTTLASEILQSASKEAAAERFQGQMDRNSDPEGRAMVSGKAYSGDAASCADQFERLEGEPAASAQEAEAPGDLPTPWCMRIDSQQLDLRMNAADHSHKSLPSIDRDGIFSQDGPPMYGDPDRIDVEPHLPRPAGEYLDALGSLRRSVHLVRGLLKELETVSQSGTGQVLQKEGQDSPLLARQEHGLDSTRLFARSLRQSFQTEISQIAAEVQGEASSSIAAGSAGGVEQPGNAQALAIADANRNRRKLDITLGSGDYEALLDAHTDRLAANYLQLVTAKLASIDQLLLQRHGHQGQ